MLKKRKAPAEKRPFTTTTGVGQIMGIHRTTVIDRQEAGDLDLSDIGQTIIKKVQHYDLEGVFRMVYPSHSDSEINDLIFGFIQENGRKVRT